ncbi:MAG: histidine ammonia-lyase [candidate division KSB1 bacterium]|nr:histidine ammonia-lyase [candidate division KSB1 bacterium]
MRKIVLDGEHLTLEDLHAAATSPLVRIEVSPQARRRMQAARQLIEERVREGRVVYGVTTGFGKLAQVVIPPEDVDQLQLNLVRSHAAGVGERLPAEVVKAALVLKANTLAKGYSGVRPEVVDVLLELYHRGVVPAVPAQGSVGASGDLAPLAHLTLVLLGEGWAEYNGELLPGGEALRRAGIEPLRLGAKEGLALLNGTQISTAIAAMALLRAENLLRCADLAAAMSLEGLLGTPASFDERIQLVRGYVGQVETARNVRQLVEESEIVASHKDCGKVQDAYSLRCVPQVHGAVREALRFVRGMISVELNAATDNPLVFAEDGEILSGGNFHAQPISMACDYLTIAVSQLANMSERRIQDLMDPVISQLPAFLAPKAGLNSGFMIAQVTTASLVSENKTLAHPASVDSIPTSANQEDFVSMAAWAARKALRVVENAEVVIAVELLAAAQAFDLRRPLRPGRGTARAYQIIRGFVPFLAEDRVLQPEIEEVVRLIRSGELVRGVGEVVTLQ